MPSADHFSTRPFYAGVLTGLRAFGVTDEGLLTGIYFQRPWHSAEVLAECTYDASARLRAMATASLPGLRESMDRLTKVVGGNPDAHDIGSLGCGCGFYAYFDGLNDHLRTPVIANFAARERVAGIIEGYGVTTVGSRGFRSSKARIVALVLPEGTYNRARILANYPDVRAYLTAEEALEAHPLTAPECMEAAS